MAAKNATPYVHTITIDGEEKKIHLKPFGSVPTGIIRRNRKDSEEGMWQIIEWGVQSPADLAVFDEIPIDDVEAVFDAWQEAGKITVGESSGSST